MRRGQMFITKISLGIEKQRFEERESIFKQV